MDWKKEAIRDLRQHGYRQASIKNMEDKIAALESQKNSVKAVMTDTDPIMGGMSTQEDRWINLVCEQERLRYAKEAAGKLVDIVEGALDKLTPTERKVLDRFYIHFTRGHVERLMGELCCEQAQVYREKDRALHKFTIVMYGIPEY